MAVGHRDEHLVAAVGPAHERLGARPLVAGQWIRPDHYGDPAAEVRAVREDARVQVVRSRGVRLYRRCLSPTAKPTPISS